MFGRVSRVEFGVECLVGASSIDQIIKCWGEGREGEGVGGVSNYCQVITTSQSVICLEEQSIKC